MSDKPTDLRGSQGAIIGATGPITQTYVGFSAQEVSALIAQIKRPDQPKTWDGRQPYLGLAAFQERDAAFFFGREQLVDELLTRLQQARFVCVAGPSGSGKSSLVQAGVLHALRQGKLPGSDKWLIERMSPQNAPVEQLSRAVAAMALSAGKPSSVGDELRSRAQSDPQALHALTGLLVQSAGAGRALLYVDQFEELFTQTHKEEERQAFLTQLTTAVAAADGALTVIISLRSDFLSQCATYPALRALISQQFQLVGSLAPDELARAIALPALEVGAQIEPELVAQLISDMKGEPGSLPLMQFALKDLFDARPHKPGDVIKLTLADSLARGGIQQALERHADAVFAQLDSGQQELAHSVFARLIEVGRGTVDTRRTADLDELAPAGVSAATLDAVVKTLADGRLITTSAGSGDEPTVTIAHEKLIDAWPWLRRLVNDNREAIALQNQVDEDAAEWQRNQRDASYLYSGARLGTVRERLAAKKIVLSGLAQEYVDAALAEREARRQAEESARRRELEQAQALAEEQRQRAEAQQQRAEVQARSTQRLRVLAFGLVAVLAVAIGAALFALMQSRAATARQLAAQSSTLVNNSVDTALLLAVEAHNRQIGDLQDVDSGLLSASQCCSDALIAFLAGHTDRVWDVAFSPNGNQLVSSADDGTLRVWDVAARQPISTLVNMSSTASIYSVAFSPDGTLLASGDGDGALTLRSTATWEMLGTPIKGHDFNIHALQFSGDGAQLVTGSGDGWVKVWDVAARTSVVNPLRHKSWVWDVAISTDGSTVASVSRDKTVHLWSLDRPVLLNSSVVTATVVTTTLVLTDQNRLLTSVAFNDDAARPLMVTGDANGGVVIWDMTPWQQNRRRPIPSAIVKVHTEIVWSLQFDPTQSDVLVSSSSSGVIRRWRVERATNFTKTTLQPLSLGVTAHASGIFRVALSPDGQTIAASGQDNLVSLWHAVEGNYVIRRPKALRSMALINDGATLLVNSADGVILTWDAATRQAQSTVQISATQPFSKSAFSPDGALLATDAADFAIHLWDANSGAHLARLPGHAKAIAALAFSPDGAWLATGDGAGMVIVWDLRQRSEHGRFPDHRGGVRALAFHADSATLVVGGCITLILFPSQDCGRGGIYLWDVSTSSRIGDPLPTKSGYVNSLAFNPADANILAVGSVDGSVSQWNIRTGAQKLAFVLDGKDINALAFSPDGAMLAVGINSYLFSLYDARTGQMFGRGFKEHDNWPFAFAFAPDDKTLYSAAYDQTVVVHSLDPTVWLARACQFANRNLTQDEWQRYLGGAGYRKSCAAP